MDHVTYQMLVDIIQRLNAIEEKIDTLGEPIDESEDNVETGEAEVVDDTTDIDEPFERQLKSEAELLKKAKWTDEQIAQRNDEMRTRKYGKAHGKVRGIDE